MTPGEKFSNTSWVKLPGHKKQNGGDGGGAKVAAKANGAGVCRRGESESGSGSEKK